MTCYEFTFEHGGRPIAMIHAQSERAARASLKARGYLCAGLYTLARARAETITGDDRDDVTNLSASARTQGKRKRRAAARAAVSVNHETPETLLPLITEVTALLRARAKSGYSALASALERDRDAYATHGSLCALGNLRQGYQAALRSLCR